MGWNTMSSWDFGEIGQRLDGNRTSEPFQNSAKEILNAYVTPMQTLRVFKDYDRTPMEDALIIDVIDTRYDFFIVVRVDRVSLISYSTLGEISGIDYSGGRVGLKCNVFANTRLAVVDQGVTLFFEFTQAGDSIIALDFLDQVSPPLRNRRIVRLDVHRVYELEELQYDASGNPERVKRKTLEKIGDGLVNPILTVQDGEVIIEEISGKVQRIYQERINTFRGYRASESEYEGDITIDDLNDGELVLNFFSGFPESGDNAQFLFNKGTVSFTEDDVDQGRQYYQMSVQHEGRGRLYYGEMVDLNGVITSVTTFQNRLVITSDETIYLSAINDYTNFTNYIEEDSPFFVTPNPISNQQPIIRNTFSSRGLFIATNRGLYSMGYNQAVSPNNPALDTISDMPSTYQVEMVDTNFFFIGEDGNLYSVQEMIESNTNRLYQFVVEKYEVASGVGGISTFRMDKYNRLITTTTQGVVRMYDVLATDDFRRVSFELDYTGKIFGVRDLLISQGVIHKASNRNKEKMTVVVHQPSLWTNTGGSLLNDKKTKVQVATVQCINQGGSSINQVYINNKKITNNEELMGNLSVYTTKASFDIRDGFPIEIDTGESTGIVEITAIEYNTKEAGRY